MFQKVLSFREKGWQSEATPPLNLLCNLTTFKLKIPKVRLKIKSNRLQNVSELNYIFGTHGRPWVYKSVTLVEFVCIDNLCVSKFTQAEKLTFFLGFLSIRLFFTGY